MRSNKGSLKYRKDLKRSADQGQLHVLDYVRKQQRSLPSLLDEKDEDHIVRLLEDSPQLGKGTYGEAHKLSPDVVAKITGVPSGLLGDVAKSPFRSENVEPRLLEFLWKHMVETHVTPHLIAPLGGKHSIIVGATKNQQAADADMKKSLVYFMELATMGTLRSHLKQQRASEKFDLLVRVLLFQICYTLEAIYMRFPTFKHNDLKDDNVMLHASSAEGHTEYIIHGVRFLVPNVGVTVMISDFDFACISGYMFDNYKVIEQEWEPPSFNINTRVDHAADFVCLITYIRAQFTPKLSKSFCNQLDSIFGALKRTNSYRATVFESDVLPCTEQILTDTTLFAPFHYNPSITYSIADTFNADKTRRDPVVFDHVWPKGGGTQEKRYTPIFSPRQQSTLDMYDLPSYRYFRACPTIFKYIDQEEPKLYAEQICNSMVEHLKSIYKLEPDFGFPESKKEAFFHLVDEIGSSFITDYYVPERWWPAAFTCAFIDAIEELNLAKPGQVCWFFEKWARFWERQGVVSYSDMQLLHFALQWGWLRSRDQKINQ